MLSEELKEVARSKNFSAGFRSISGGSVKDINCFVECLDAYLKNGMTINGLQYDFIVNPFSTLALLRVELRAGEDLRQIDTGSLS